MRTKDFVYNKAKERINLAKNKLEIDEALSFFKKVLGLLDHENSLRYRELEEQAKQREIAINKKMSYEEFKENFQEHNRHWQFASFKIVCNKCGSYRVEFNSDMELETGYYDSEFDVTGRIIVKCHECGNAMELDFGDLRS